MTDLIEFEQGDDAWFAIKCGKFSGTRFADVLAKSKPSKANPEPRSLKAREDLIWTLATERIQGYMPQGLTSYALRWGSENEPRAREAYELATGAFVTQQGFTLHKTLGEFVGASLDGLVDEDGTIEIKCPKSPEIHMQRFLNGVPEEYIPQIQGGLWVSDRKWCDFISYDPDTDERFKLLIIRVYRDEAYIKNLEREVLVAEGEVRELIKKLIAKIE